MESYLHNLIYNLNKFNKKDVSELVLKLAQEQQLELFPKDSTKRICELCGEPNSPHDVLKVSNDLLMDHQLTPYVKDLKDSYQICLDCYREKIYKCVFCDESLDPEDLSYDHNLFKGEVIDKSGEPTYVPRLRHSQKYPVCEECDYRLYETCSDCNEAFLVGEVEKVNSDLEKVCEECSKKYYSCAGCQSLVNIEHDIYNIADGEVYCENCPVPNFNDVYAINKNISEIQKTFSVNDFIPIAPHTLQKIINFGKPLYEKFKNSEVIPDKISTRFWNAIEKIEKTPEEELFLAKFLKVYTGYYDPKDIQVDKLKSLIESHQQTEIIKNNLLSGYERDSRAKNVKSYTPMSVEFSVEYPRNQEHSKSFVVLMAPSRQMFQVADMLFGKAGKDAWDILGQGHWPGHIGYARVSDQGGSLVIENLQSDADLYAFANRIKNSRFSKPDRYAEKVQVERAAKWWAQQIKNWATHMILVLINYAKNRNLKLYLTSFEHQVEKWKSIPDRNRDLYEGIPSDLRKMRLKSLKKQEEDLQDSDDVFPRREYRDFELEHGDSNVDFWRLARRISRLNKINKIS